MNRRPRKKQSGLTRPKAILIGGLGIVLLGVWGNALLGGSKPTVARRDPSNAVERRRLPRRATRPAGQQDARQQTISDWPVISLDEAMLNDPFAPPQWARRAAAEETRGKKSRPSSDTGESDLAEQNASIVVIAGSRKVATIGDREIHVGDSIDGYEVLDITPNGVVMAARQDLAGRNGQ